MQKNAKFFWGGGTAPSPDPSLSGEGDTPSPHPTPFGASILTPLPILTGAVRTYARKLLCKSASRIMGGEIWKLTSKAIDKQHKSEVHYLSALRHYIHSYKRSPSLRHWRWAADTRVTLTDDSSTQSVSRLSQTILPHVYFGACTDIC